MPHSHAGTTAFTYQGRIKDAGALATASYDMKFTLYNALTAGSAVGSPVTVAPVAVMSGVFSVTLDFGSTPFDGGARWLQIDVRANGSTGSYTTQSPRLAIQATPYAIRTENFSGTVTAAQVPNLDGASLTSGTIPDARFSTAISRSVDVTNLVNSTSNGLSSRLVGTNDALIALINSLTASVVTLSNQVKSNVLSASTFVSSDPVDPALLGQGFSSVMTVAAPAWVNGTSTGVPAARFGHSAVWTGQEMINWGGTLGAGLYSSGGAWYAPSSDAWTTVSTVGAPSARSGHTAVWSGSEMIVWGGFSGTSYLATGGRFSVSNQVWSPVVTNGAPPARHGHIAVWTGSRMVVWGGRNSTGTLASASGGAYSPSDNTWAALSLANPPTPRYGFSAVWAGDRMLLWGGDGTNGYLNTGAQLLCTGGVPSQWNTNVSLSGAPSARTAHTVVWTGSRMIVWGGYGSAGFLGNGAAYNPLSDTWTPLSSTNAPLARMLHNAVWTGTEMIIYGGETASGTTATGAAYDPATDKWRLLSNPGSPQARSEARAVWTGSEVIIFGGRNGGSPLAALQRLTPQPTWYFFRKP